MSPHKAKTLKRHLKRIIDRPMTYAMIEEKVLEQGVKIPHYALGIALTTECLHGGLRVWSGKFQTHYPVYGYDLDTLKYDINFARRPIVPSVRRVDRRASGDTGVRRWDAPHRGRAYGGADAERFA